MKNQISILTFSILASVFLSSCNSCNKKTDGTTEVETTDVTAPDYVDTAPDSISTAEMNNESANDQASSTSSSTSNTNTKAKNTNNSSKTDKDTKGYSAPDGTDAENNDGDQYTRNDTKPQPSGPPIK